MNLYVEKISRNTYNKMKQFLEDNPSKELDFHVFQEGIELYKEALDELYESTSAFRKDFDDIISCYRDQEGAIGEDAYNERMLITDINQRLNNLYSRFIENTEVWTMLYEFSSKIIKK